MPEEVHLQDSHLEVEVGARHKDEAVEVRHEDREAPAEELGGLPRRQDHRGQEQLAEAEAYYISLPPLRERKTDIVLLAEYFLERFASLYRMPPSILDASAKTALEAYSYPGNVRELEQLMNKVAVETAGRPITETSLRPYLRQHLQSAGADLRSWEALPFHEAIARWEQHLIERALLLSGGNKSDAAKRLGIQRRLLYEKMQRFMSS